jgi:hypothetical protein
MLRRGYATGATRQVVEFIEVPKDKNAREHMRIAIGAAAKLPC